MFGLEFSEILILLVVGIVVVGPKRLPEMMRKAGGYIAKLRRLSTNLRAQSGIDRILREEGLDKEIRELRALKESLSKQAMLDGLVNAVNRPAPSRPLAAPKPSPGLPAKPAENAEAAKTDDAKATEATENRPPTPAAPAEPSAAEVPATAAAPEAATQGDVPVIRPAAGIVARNDQVGRPDPAVKNPFRSVREREYPSYGPDHYDALPDDLEEDELEQPAAEAATVTEETTAPAAREATS